MGMVPPPLVRRREESSMGYQPLPPKRARRGKAQPKQVPLSAAYPEMRPEEDHRIIPEGYGSYVTAKETTERDLLPLIEGTDWPYDPRLLGFVCGGKAQRKHEEYLDRWFGLPDDHMPARGGQSNSALLRLMKALERMISGVSDEQVRYLPGEHHPTVQSDPEEIFPLKYRSPVVPAPEQAALLNRPPNPRLTVVIRK